MLNFDSWKTVFVFLDFGNYVVMTGEQRLPRKWIRVASHVLKNTTNK